MSRLGRKHGHSAFTMIETVISLLIVGMVLVAVMQTVAVSRTAQRLDADRTIGLVLAEMLMTEILQKPYDEPSGAASIGQEAGETVAGSRAAYDDVDDFNGWSESTAADAAGTPVANGAGFSRTISVQYVQPAAVDTTSGTDTGVKRIRVLVKKGERKVIELTAYRSRAWDDPYRS